MKEVEVDGEEDEDEAESKRDFDRMKNCRASIHDDRGRDLGPVLWCVEEKATVSPC